MRKLRIKSQFYEQILRKLKTLEVRVGYNNIVKIFPGQLVELATHDRHCIAEIKAIREYSSFEKMLEEENHGKIFPGLTKTQVLNALRELYNKEQENLGVYVFEIVLT